MAEREAIRSEGLHRRFRQSEDARVHGRVGRGRRDGDSYRRAGAVLSAAPRWRNGKRSDRKVFIGDFGNPKTLAYMDELAAAGVTVIHTGGPAPYYPLRRDGGTGSDQIGRSSSAISAIRRRSRTWTSWPRPA